MQIRATAALVAFAPVLGIALPSEAAVQKTIRDKNGVVVASFPVHGRVHEFIDVQPNGKISVTTFYDDATGARQNREDKDIDPDAQDLNRIEVSLSNGQKLTFSAWGYDNMHVEGSLRIDPSDTDICDQPVAGCETFDGEPLEPDWSITDAGTNSVQTDGTLVIDGNGTALIETPDPNLCFVMQDIGADPTETGDVITLDFYYNPVGGGPEFLGLTEEFHFSPSPVPAAADWALAVMLLLVLGAGALVLAHRRSRSGSAA